MMMQCSKKMPIQETQIEAFSAPDFTGTFGDENREADKDVDMPIIT